ncbi:hypothetical protein [Ferruginibacter sp. HRS2-29]|uniref:hypothetical protein n=1 Tax=Ferruginibacter sp. HRS2-29 TaxID=2487334 RepID=UPI0020CD23F0|nr:hypothetical protein [Ferruginibacter sp. HRS2-29]MCP9750607.1 hypothetical protein [Ferruginibacter sp. HRS2-29]
MRTASVKEIKTELEHLPQDELVKLCLRLIKFKKETKELAGYLLFDAHNEQEYTEQVKEMLDDLFAEVNTRNLYITKKNLRKIVRIAGKYIKYSDEKTTEIELLIFVCKRMQKLKIDYKKSVQLQNLYAAQVKKINKAISVLHEDLQYDYLKEIDEL